MSIFDPKDNPLVLPVIVLDDPEKALPLAEILLENGINWIEITMRTDAAIDSISRISKCLPEMRVGAGTVLSKTQARQVIEAGAVFGLAPGLNAGVVDVFREASIPFVPGVCTPTEITTALSLGCRDLKFFPAEAAGGLKFLKSILAPFTEHSLKFCPTGGIHLGNMTDYLEIPEVFTVGGTWLATRKQIYAGDWRGIASRCSEAIKTARSLQRDS